MTAQGRIRGRMPILLSLSAAGRSNPGNPGSDVVSIDATSVAGRDENVLLKLIVDADTDRLLGCHILGSNAAELVQLVAIAVRMGATKGDLDATMALHPTVAEELVTMREPKKRYRRAAAE